MISRIVINKLHNLYDYDILFPEDRKVCILTGPNGYGKTTILKILNHVLECKFWYFYFIKFTSISIFFSNGKTITIRKEKEDINKDSELSEIENSRETIRVSLFLSATNEEIQTISLGGVYMARLRRLVSREFYTYDDPDLEEMLEVGYRMEEDTYLSDNGASISLYLSELSSLFVKEQRLLSPVNILERRYASRAYSKAASEVQRIASDLKGLYINNQRKYASKCQEIDATFIKRLAHGVHSYDVTEFRKKLADLKSMIEKYRKFALTSQTDNILEEYPEELRNVFSLYLDDMREKLSVFEDFYQRLSVFERFVSGKSLSNKRIEVNGAKGISVYNDNDEEIPLDKLSSGEQNLIVLYYRLAFSTKKNSLLLVDEPENSLHMAWLRLMLRDYQEMAKSLDCQILIATHSPVFIDGQWDMTCDLFTNSMQKN